MGWFTFKRKRITYHFECFHCGDEVTARLDTLDELQDLSDALNDHHRECKPIGMCNAAELKHALRFRGSDG